MANIYQALHNKGYRITNQRKQILDALNKFPQSVEEIFSVLKSKNEDVDKVTIYRTLDRFVELGVVGKTQFKDKTAKYELITDSHHHHLICNNYGSVQDIALSESLPLRKVKEQTNFRVESHSLEFFRLCASCQ